MTVKRWEYRRVEIYTNTAPQEETGRGYTFYYYGKKDLDWKDNEIARLGREGWELVGVVPNIGGRAKESGGTGWGVSYTLSVSLFFKRPLE